MGAWLILFILIWPRVTGYTPSPQALCNDLIVGALLGATGFLATRSASSMLNWAQCALGAWLIVAPILLAYPHTDSGINDIAIGLVLATVGCIAAVVKMSAVRTRKPGV